MNKVFLIGRLTKDPELRQTANGISYCGFTLAVDRRYKNAQGEKETDFIDISTWRSLADNCSKFLSKGKMAAVGGSIQTRKWDDKDGKKKVSFFVQADDVQFLSPRNGDSANTHTEVQPTNSSFFGSCEADDDLPF